MYHPWNFFVNLIACILWKLYADAFLASASFWKPRWWATSPSWTSFWLLILFVCWLLQVCCVLKYVCLLCLTSFKKTHQDNGQYHSSCCCLLLSFAVVYFAFVYAFRIVQALISSSSYIVGLVASLKGYPACCWGIFIPFHYVPYFCSLILAIYRLSTCCNISTLWKSHAKDSKSSAAKVYPWLVSFHDNLYHPQISCYV